MYCPVEITSETVPVKKPPSSAGAFGLSIPSALLPEISCQKNLTPAVRDQNAYSLIFLGTFALGRFLLLPGFNLGVAL